MGLKGLWPFMYFFMEKKRARRAKTFSPGPHSQHTQELAPTMPPCIYNII